jgi:NAD-dependent deacetylase
MTAPETLARWLRESRFTVFFTGAGMSTESGLPDFRSAGGLWRNRRFSELASVDALASDYEAHAAFYRWRIGELERFAPHRGHERIAAWQRQGLVHALITQNVDGFHERAGSSPPLNLHGTLALVRCHDCGAERPAATFLAPEGAACARCGGRMRAGVVLFGEALDEPTLAAAFAASRRATLFVVLGSSLVVSPANLLPEAAVRAGARLVIVNREATPLDGDAQLVIDAAIGATLEEVAAALA